MSKVYRCVILFACIFVCCGKCFADADPSEYTFESIPDSWQPDHHFVAIDTIDACKIGFILIHRFDNTQGQYIFTPYFEVMPLNVDEEGVAVDELPEIVFGEVYLEFDDARQRLRMEPDTAFATTRSATPGTIPVEVLVYEKFRLAEAPSRLKLVYDVRARAANSGEVLAEETSEAKILPVERVEGLYQWATAEKINWPFSPTTEFTFSVETPGPVSLVIKNVRGEPVATLVDEPMDLGIYTVRWNPSTDIPSGVYFYKITTPDGVFTRKMVLIR